METAVGKLVRRIEALQHAGLLRPLAEQLRALAPTMSLPWLPNLYPAAVLKQLFEVSSEKDLAALLVSTNRFETALRDLWRKGAGVAKLIGTPFPYAAPTDETVRKLATGRELVRFQNAVKDWAKQFDDFQQAFALHQHIEGSGLGAARNEAKQWQAAVERFLDTSGVAFEHVFVVDTNALIDCPDLPKRLRSTQLLVLPATVIDELDKKKTDPQLRQQCAQAVRNLRAMPTAGIRFETADLTLLPDDYRKTNDSRILSVAVKYANSNLRLVTGDQNLSLKAQGMAIIAVGVERFMERPAPRRNSSGPTVPGSPAVTNKKKRTGNMSRIADYTWQIEQAQRREAYLNRIRATTSEFVGRYEAVLAEVRSGGLDRYVAAEFGELESALRRLRGMLASDPEGARDASRQIAQQIHTLPRLARDAQRHAAELEQQGRQQLSVELRMLLEQVLGDIADPVEREFAYAGAATLRDDLEARLASGAGLEKIRRGRRSTPRTGTDKCTTPGRGLEGRAPQGCRAPRPRRCTARIPNHGTGRRRAQSSCPARIGHHLDALMAPRLVTASRRPFTPQKTGLTPPSLTRNAVGQRCARCLNRYKRLASRSITASRDRWRRQGGDPRAQTFLAPGRVPYRRCGGTVLQV